MILLDVVEEERRKVVNVLTPGPSLRHPEPAAAPSTSSLTLPDYKTSQAQAGYLKLEDGEKPIPKKSGGRRLARAIIYALIIYLVLSIAIGVPLFVVLRNNARENDIRNSDNWMKNNVNLQPPPPLEFALDALNLSTGLGAPLQCNDWTYVSAAASTTGGPYFQLKYSLPLDETVYIRSNFSAIDSDDDIYSPITGSLRVGMQSDGSLRNATVTVTVPDNGKNPSRRSHVCLMGGNATYGLYITVPDDTDEDDYYFDVDLRLPSTQSPCPMSNFETYLPSFNQTFEQLDPYMNLDTFDVEGSLGSVYIESIHAKNIIVRSSAASITGTFNASDKIVLETVLQPITANVSLYNEGYDEDPTHLSLETGNSDISLNATLRSLSNGSAACPPWFTSSLRTFGGSIQAAYSHEPTLPSSLLYVRASNTMQPAQVFVDSVYQGTYEVHTSLADAVVDRADVSDPTGAGRKRLFIDDLVTSNRAYGWVGWDQRPNSRLVRQGHIDVESSLSPAILQLTDVPNMSVQASNISETYFYSRDSRTES